MQLAFCLTNTIYQGMSKKRKYTDEYNSSKCTFIIERDRTLKPQCFLCGKVIASGSMKPSKSKERLQSFHSNTSSDDIDQLRMNKTRFEKVGTFSKHGFITTKRPFLEALYKVAYRIAKQTKLLTVEETLINHVPKNGRTGLWRKRKKLE